MTNQRLQRTYTKNHTYHIDAVGTLQTLGIMLENFRSFVDPLHRTCLGVKLLIANAFFPVSVSNLVRNLVRSKLIATLLLAAP